MEFATFVLQFLAISFVHELPVQAQPGAWLTNPPLKATHFWDCSGAACDATTLKPWDPAKYRYSPMYAPLNPTDYGGSKYGEKMWMTGAANDYLSDLMGSDAACCGKDASKPGGCGKCLLLRNPAAVNADWTVLVMKKNRCPPHSHGCGPGLAHFDLAVPGFDNLQYSTANTCGDANTYITKDQSDTCGSWYTSATDTSKSTCCNGLPDSTPEQRIMKAGCKLFAAWGWKRGDPGGLHYQAVECPAKFEKLIGDAFGPSGLVGVGSGSSQGPSTSQPLSTRSPSGAPPCECRSTGSCGCGWATENTCATNDNTPCNTECCCKFRCSDLSTTKANNPVTTKANDPAPTTTTPATTAAPTTTTAAPTTTTAAPTTTTAGPTITTTAPTTTTAAPITITAAPTKVTNPATTKANDPTTTKANDSATTKANDSATTKANDSATTKANDSATTKANNSATTKANDPDTTKFNPNTVTIEVAVNGSCTWMLNTVLAIAILHLC